MRHGLQLAVIVWDCLTLQWIMGSCDRWEFPQFFNRSHWQSPCTAQTAGICLLLGLCKGTVEESRVGLGVVHKGRSICPTRDQNRALWPHPDPKWSRCYGLCPAPGPSCNLILQLPENIESSDVGSLKDANNHSLKCWGLNEHGR